MKQILLVCTGNICRTPMAVALLRQALAGAGLGQEVAVDSAGTGAVVGAPASAGSARAMAGRGLDLSAHRGKQLDARLVDEADLILVMEEGHRRSIFYSWPRALSKTYLLSEMAGEHVDVADPIGQDQAAYDRTAGIIAAYVRRGLPQIVKRLGLPDMKTPPEMT